MKHARRPLGLLSVLLILSLGSAPPRALAIQPIKDVPFDQEYHEPHPLNSDAERDVRAIAVEKSGRVWIATGAGPRFLNGQQWSAPAAGSDAATPAYSVFVDAKGQVWVGGWNGIYRADASTVALAGADGAAIVAFAGSAVKAGEAQQLYAAGPDGIWRQEGAEWKKSTGSWASTVRDIAVGPKGDFWVATMIGLDHEDPANAATEPEHYFQPDALLSSNVHSLAWGPDGRLWIGSTGGIDAYSGTRRVLSLSVKEGLPYHQVRGMKVDAEGRLWIATPRGVARYDNGHWAFRHSRRWLLSDDARDIAIGGDGTAWVATAGGVSAIRHRKMTLQDKADYYLKNTRARHVRAPGFVQKADLKAQGDLSTSWIPDTDNDGLFTADYVSAESFRYAVTGAADAQANARESFGALEFLQTITGTPHFIARAAVPKGVPPRSDTNRTYTGAEYADERVDDARWKKVEERWLPSADGQWLWKRDTSSDETTGHLMAYATYFDLAAGEQDRPRVAGLTARVVGGMIEHGFTFQDIDGQATRWGVWSPEKLNSDPSWRPERGINSVEILSYLNVAWQQTGDQRFFNASRELLDKNGYGTNVLRPRPTAPSEVTYIDDQLLALAYPSLLSYEADPNLRSIYQASMRNWHGVVRRDHSPLYDFVYARFSGDDLPLEGAADVLRDWPLDLVEWTVDNRGREDIEIDTRPGLEDVQTTRRLPPSEHGVIRWDDNPYSVVRGENGMREDEGVSWLLPYWMGRYYGFIEAPAAEGAAGAKPATASQTPNPANAPRTAPSVPSDLLPKKP